MTRLLVFALLIPSVAHSAQGPRAEELIELNVPVVFVSRVSGHDDAMWRLELVSAVHKSFGKEPATAATASPNPLLGSWVAQDDTKQVVHFEAARCIFARIGEAGSARFTRAAYAPGLIKTHSWAQKKEYAFELKENRLSLTELPAGNTRRYRKLEETPAEVEIKPLKLGEAKSVPEEKVRTVREELKHRGKLDQEVRTDPIKLKDMAKVDADNTKFLVELVREVGWIDVERFGAAASQEAFLIVQHSLNVSLMLAALPSIEKDVRSKRLDGQPYALLFDRLRVTLGEKQRFGSQLGSDLQGELLLMPLEDRARVDDLRKELGMVPLTEYLKYFEKQNGGKSIRFLED